MKVTDIFKVIIFAFLVITFTVSAAACKEAPVVEEQVVEEQQQEEEKAEVIISSETKETPSVVEETPEKIEWEGVSFSPIEGLRFDKGDFYFMEGNEYGGIPGEKAGELITDANVEIDGKIENIFFGLRPEVIEVILKKIIEEKKEFKYPLPLFAKGMKIKEVKDTERDDWAKSEGLFWDNNTFLEISSVPIGTIIYSPVSASDYLIWDNNLGRNDPSEPSWYMLRFEEMIPEVYKGSLLFKNERVDSAFLEIGAVGISLLPPGTEKNIAKNELGGYSFLTEAKMGGAIAEVVSKDNLPRFDDPDYNPEASYNPDLSSIEIYFPICQLKNKNDKKEFSNISKTLSLGLVGLLKIGNIPVYISP